MEGSVQERPVEAPPSDDAGSRSTGTRSRSRASSPTSRSGSSLLGEQAGRVPHRRRRGRVQGPLHPPRHRAVARLGAGRPHRLPVPRLGVRPERRAACGSRRSPRARDPGPGPRRSPTTPRSATASSGWRWRSRWRRSRASRRTSTRTRATRARCSPCWTWDDVRRPVDRELDGRLALPVRPPEHPRAARSSRTRSRTCCTRRTGACTTASTTSTTAASTGRSRPPSATSTTSGSRSRCTSGSSRTATA